MRLPVTIGSRRVGFASRIGIPGRPLRVEMRSRVRPRTASLVIRSGKQIIIRGTAAA
jgi:hypothetical protein